MLQRDGQLMSSIELELIDDATLEEAHIQLAPESTLRQPLPRFAPFGVEVSVVIAAMNEEKNLPYVFSRLPEGLHEVILVDGHSVDETVAVARAATA